MSNPPKTREEMRRLQQEAAAKRARITRMVGGVAAVLALAMIVLVIVVVVKQHNDNSVQAAANASTQVTPPHADGTQGIVVNKGIATAGKVPTLVEYQDYQCPICKEYGSFYGTVLNKMSAEGSIILEYRTMTFMDSNLSNTASSRSAVAAACADTVGAYSAYHDAVYAKQASSEIQGGIGYSDADLRVNIPALVGMTGTKLTSFQECYDKQRTLSFVDAVNTNAAKAGITQTPTFQINGKTFDISQDKPDEATLKAAIDAAAGLASSTGSSPTSSS